MEIKIDIDEKNKEMSFLDIPENEMFKFVGYEKNNTIYIKISSEKYIGLYENCPRIQVHNIAPSIVVAQVVLLGQPEITIKKCQS